MKKLIFLSLFIGITFPTIAQSKITIGIFPVINNAKSTKVDIYCPIAQEAVASNIEDKIISVFLKTNRFVIVDRSKLVEIKKEKELQKTEDFIDSKTIEQFKNLGAEYLLFCNVTDISCYFTDKQIIGGNIYFYSFSIRVTKVETGEILFCSVFTKIEDKKIEKTILKLIKKQFPL